MENTNVNQQEKKQHDIVISTRLTAKGIKDVLEKKLPLVRDEYYVLKFNKEDGNPEKIGKFLKCFADFPIQTRAYTTPKYEARNQVAVKIAKEAYLNGVKNKKFSHSDIKKALIKDDDSITYFDKAMEIDEILDFYIAKKDEANNLKDQLVKVAQEIYDELSNKGFLGTEQIEMFYDISDFGIGASTNIKKDLRDSKIYEVFTYNEIASISETATPKFFGYFKNLPSIEKQTINLSEELRLFKEEQDIEFIARHFKVQSNNIHFNDLKRDLMKILEREQSFWSDEYMEKEKLIPMLEETIEKNNQILNNVAKEVMEILGEYFKSRRIEPDSIVINYELSERGLVNAIQKGFAISNNVKTVRTILRMEDLKNVDSEKVETFFKFYKKELQEKDENEAFYIKLDRFVSNPVIPDVGSYNEELDIKDIFEINAPEDETKYASDKFLDDVEIVEEIVALIERYYVMLEKANTSIRFKVLKAQEEEEARMIEEARIEEENLQKQKEEASKQTFWKKTFGKLVGVEN